MTGTGLWALDADRVLATVFADVPRDIDERELRARLRKAYPFGERKYWPYKVWLHRVRAWLFTWRAGLSLPPVAGVKRRHFAARDRETLDLFDRIVADAAPLAFPVHRTLAIADVLATVGAQPHRFAEACL